MRSFMKTFFKYFGVFVFLFSFSQVALADCPVTLQCGERLELSWSHSGTVSGCQVSSPSGLPIPGGCNSNGWTSNGVPVQTGDYTFVARDQNGQLLPPATCQVTAPPANCGTTGGTYEISAAPNPVQICSPQTTGKSLISWTAPAGQAVTVRVPSGVFAAGNGNGSQWTTNDGTASTPGWIVPTSNITFTLHDASGVLKDSITVTGTNSGCSTGGTGYCGDGIVQNPNAVPGHPATNEQCDDGNNVNGDGCSSICQVETPSPTQYFCQSSMCSACGGTTGVTCPTSGTYSTSAACNNACGSTGGTQYYKCDGTSCVSSGQYPDLNACIAATGGAQNCKTTPNCDNQCSTQTQNLYYRCATPGSGQSCTTSVNQPCAQGEAGCYSLNSNPNAATRCANYCGAQLYQCEGDCEPCGQSGQSVCGSGATPYPNCNFQCQSTASCGLDANPTTQTVGQTVGLTLTKSVVNGGGSTIEWDTCTVNANGAQTVPGTTNPWNGTSGAINLGNNTFSASCNYQEFFGGVPSGGGTVQCAASTVTGTIATPVTRYQCSGGSGPCTATTCDPSSDACMNSTYATQGACEAATSCNASTPTLDADCVGVVLPSRVLVGRQFIVTPSFYNSGTTAWTTSFRLISSSFNWSAWNGLLSFDSTVGQFGTLNQGYTFLAPSTAGNYSLQFQMRNALGVPFGDICVAYTGSTPGVDVSAPECRDNVDNDEDGIIDFAGSDPGCDSADDDNETDPAPGVTLKISANPQLVRFGGSSTVTYEVNNCTITNAEGDLVPGTWTLLRDGAQIGTGISGTSTTGGQQSYPVYNIQNKTTFTLSCGGTTRSATISVIKINEI